MPLPVRHVRKNDLIPRLQSVQNFNRIDGFSTQLHGRPHRCPAVVHHLEQTHPAVGLAMVREAMQPYLTEEWGNPSSSYRFGAKLKGVTETARAQVAALIGSPSGDFDFTSCATERMFA